MILKHPILNDDTKGTADRYAEAMIDALHRAAVDGTPDIRAALAACTMIQADLVSRIPDRKIRRGIMTSLDNLLRSRVVGIIANAGPIQRTEAGQQ